MVDSTFRRRAAACLLFGLLLVTLIACSEAVNPDKRALPDSESDVSLSEALTDFSVSLPGEASAVEYGLFASVDTGLTLKFDLPCSEIGSFLSASGMPPLTRAVPNLAEVHTNRYGWEIPGAAVRGAEDKGEDGMYRGVKVQQMPGHSCRVVLAGVK
jgi:hypothetical protein